MHKSLSLGKKGQWFLISTVMASVAFLTISFLFKDYFIVDTSTVAINDEDFYFWDIKDGLSDTVNVIGFTDCDKLDRSLEEFIHLSKISMAEKGYFLYVEKNIDCEALESTPLDIMLVMDNSTSMEDWSSDSKQAAKYFVDLIDASKDRIGVVPYSDSARVDQPLTYDQAAVKNFIDSLDPGGRTGIGFGLQAATNHLISEHREGAVLVEILLTDGNDTVDSEPLDRANEAKDQGIVIYTIGLGSAVAESAELETLLRNIAGNGGGYYYAPSGSDLEGIYTEIAGEVLDITSDFGILLASDDMLLYENVNPCDIVPSICNT